MSAARHAIERFSDLGSFTPVLTLLNAPLRFVSLGQQSLAAMLARRGVSIHRFGHPPFPDLSLPA